MVQEQIALTPSIMSTELFRGQGGCRGNIPTLIYSTT